MTLLSCGDCGLVFTDPLQRDRVRRRYLTEYDLAEHFGHVAPRKRALFERRLEQLPAPAPGRDRLIDVGCADGQFAELAARLGWRVDGVELNPPAAARARQRGVNVHEGPFEALDQLPWGSFDLVTSWDVLEHTPDPRPFAERLARLARPGATVALTTLNRRSLVAWLFGMRWAKIGEEHFTYWDRRSLVGLLNAAGMEVEQLSTFGLGRDLFRWLDRLQGHLRRNPGEAGRVSGAGPPGRAARGWDTLRGVLMAERAVNTVLAAVGGGIELYAVARPADRRGGRAARGPGPPGPA
ncbi:MAG: class I SAM-dependent methyltransferase [Solirubrobacterales bacterium]